MFAIGGPSEIWSADVRRSVEDQIVVSVGPYMFQSSRQRGSSWQARSDVRASPPQKIRRSLFPSQSLSTSMRQVVGVACIAVTACSVSSFLSSRPSAACSAVAMTIWAPHTKGRRNSRIEISNEVVVTARSVSEAAIPGVSAMDRRKLTSARRGIMTPLGFPVEPEV